MRLSTVDGSSAPLRTHLLVGSDACLADVLCSSVESVLFVSLSSTRTALVSTPSYAAPLEVLRDDEVVATVQPGAAPLAVEVGNVLCPIRSSTIRFVKAIHLLDDDAPDPPGTRWPRRPLADARTAEALREVVRLAFWSLCDEMLPILRSFPDSAGHPRGDAKDTCAHCRQACSLVVMMTWTGKLCHQCFVGPPAPDAAWVVTRAGRVFEALRRHIQPPPDVDHITRPPLVFTFLHGATINFADVFARAAPVLIAMNSGSFSDSLLIGALRGMPDYLTSDRKEWILTKNLICFGYKKYLLPMPLEVGVPTKTQGFLEDVPSVTSLVKDATPQALHDCIFGGLNAWNHLPPTEPAVSRATWTSGHTNTSIPTETTGVEWLAAYCFYVGEHTGTAATWTLTSRQNSWEANQMHGKILLIPPGVSYKAAIHAPQYLVYMQPFLPVYGLAHSLHVDRELRNTDSRVSAAQAALRVAVCFSGLAALAGNNNWNSGEDTGESR